MMNPNVTLAVAYERMADMRKRAERDRVGRQAIAARRASGRRSRAGRLHVYAATTIPAGEAGHDLSAELLGEQQLCLTGARED
jgi:hypothetical protein